MKRIGQVGLSVVLAVAIVFVWSFAVPVRRVQASSWVLPVMAGLGGFPTAGLALAAVLAVGGIIAIQTGFAHRAIVQTKAALATTLSAWWASLTPAAQSRWDAAGEAVVSTGVTSVSTEMQADWDWWTMEYAQREFVDLPFPRGLGWSGTGGSNYNWGTDVSTVAGMLAAAYFVARHVSGATAIMYCSQVRNWNGDMRCFMHSALISEMVATHGYTSLYLQDSLGVGNRGGYTTLASVIGGVSSSLRVPYLPTSYWGTRYVDNPYAWDSLEGMKWTWEAKVWPEVSDYLNQKEWTDVPDEWTIEKCSIGDSIPIGHEQDLGEEVTLGPDIVITWNPDVSEWEIDGVPVPDTIIGPVPPGGITPPTSGEDTGLLTEIKDLLGSLAGAIAAAISAAFVGDWASVDLNLLKTAFTNVSTKFPLSLPWDLGRIISVFDVPVATTAPDIVLALPGGMWGTGEVILSFPTGFTRIVQFLRWGLVIIWDIGLISWASAWFKAGSE